MNIVILGAGEVGWHLAESLSTRQHNISVIDASESRIAELQERLDAQVICGNGILAATLAESNVAEADVFLALTSDDSANLVAASLARSIGAKKTIVRVHARLQREEWLFDYKTHFKIDYLFSTHRLAAIELAKHVRNPERLFVEEIARGRIEVQQIQISDQSSALARPLKDLNFPSRVRIGSIRRDDRHFIPSGQDELRAGDLVTVFGEPNKVAEVLPRLRAGPPPDGEVAVVIFGGGEYGFALAQMLAGRRHKVRIFERDPGVCRRISELLSAAVVIQADATSLQQLKEERVGDAEFFIAASTDDEDNVMACLQAKSLGTRYCLALIHRADYAEVVMRNSDQLQIHAAVSPRLASSRDLLRFISTEKYVTVMTLAGGAQVLETGIGETSPLAGRKVSEIQWPEGCVLVALLRGSEALVPTGEDKLQGGDLIYAIVAESARKGFVRLLGPA